MTCSSLSPKSNPKSVYFLLRSVAGSFSSSPNFLNCSSPRESASVFADYLRCHFSLSQPKVLRIKARGYLSELHRATCSEESHSSFCFPFSPAEFFVAASILSSSTATGLDRVAYLMLKHLHCSGMNLLLQIFKLSWPLLKPLDSLLPSSLSLSPPASRSFLNASFYRVYSFNSLFFPARRVSAIDGLL